MWFFLYIFSPNLWPSFPEANQLRNASGSIRCWSDNDFARCVDNCFDERIGRWCKSKSSLNYTNNIIKLLQHIGYPAGHRSRPNAGTLSARSSCSLVVHAIPGCSLSSSLWTPRRCLAQIVTYTDYPNHNDQHTNLFICIYLNYLFLFIPKKEPIFDAKYSILTKQIGYKN